MRFNLMRKFAPIQYHFWPFYAAIAVRLCFVFRSVEWDCTARLGQMTKRGRNVIGFFHIKYFWILVFTLFFIKSVSNLFWKYLPFPNLSVECKKYEWILSIYCSYLTASLSYSFLHSSVICHYWHRYSQSRLPILRYFPKSCLWWHCLGCAPNETDTFRLWVSGLVCGALVQFLNCSTKRCEA